MNNSGTMTEKINSFMATHKYQELQLSKATFRYLLCGEGKQTLVFLDGGMGTSEIWFEYITYFEKDYQILTFSFPHNLPTNSGQASAIQELLAKLNIAKATFIGVSYGTLLAQLFAKKYPDYVEGLVLLSGGGLTEETKAALKKYKLLFTLSVLSAKILPFNLVKKNIIKDSIKNLTNENNSKAQESLIKEAVYQLYKDCSKATVMNMGYLLLDVFKTENCIREDFAYLTGKTLVLFPEKDFFPRQSQESLVSLMTKPEIIWIAEGAHGDPMFNPEYMANIAFFLKERAEA